MRAAVGIGCMVIAAMGTGASFRAEKPMGEAELPHLMTADAVEIGVGWVSSVGVAGKMRILTSNIADIEGTIQGQPFGSEIRGLIRCNDERTWRALEGVANSSANGDWRIPGATLIGTRSGTHFCQLMAIVAPPFSEQVLEEGALSRKQYRSSNIVDLEIDPRLRTSAVRDEVTVSLVAGQPVASPAAIPVPTIFDMTGRTRNIAPGARLWPLYNCDGAAYWTGGNPVEVAPDGSWTAAMVSLSSARAASQCMIIVTAADPGNPNQVSAEDARKLTVPHSMPIRLVQQPPRIEIVALTQKDGEVLFIDSELQKHSRQTVQLGSEVGSIDIEGEQLPRDISASLAIQEEGSVQWFVSAAEAQGVGVWSASNVRLIMPGAAGKGRLLRVITTRRKDLDGRALTGGELESAAIGMSSIVQVEAPQPPRCDGAGVQATRIAGRDLSGLNEHSGESAGTIEPIVVGRTSVVEGRTSKSCPGMVPLVGISGGIDGNRWRLSRVRPDARGVWRETISFPDADPESQNADGTLVTILAPDVFAGRSVDRPWLNEYAVLQSSARVTVRLPPSSLTVRWGAFLRRFFGYGGLFDMTMQFLFAHVWLMVGALAALFLLAVLRRNLSEVRAAFNGFVDAWNENARCRLMRTHGLKLSPVGRCAYEDRLNHERDETKARLQEKLCPEIAALEKKIAELDSSIAKFERGAAFQTDAPPARLSAVFHHPAFAVMTTGELTFNFVAFRILSDVDAVTFAASLAIGVALPVAAYYIGSRLRNSQKLGVRDQALLTTVTAGIVAALWSINAIRVAHMSADAGMVAHNPALRYAFLPVNILVVLAAAILAYLRNEPVGGRADALLENRRQVKRRERLTPKLAKFKARLEAAGKRLDAHYARLTATYRTSFERYLRYPHAGRPIVPNQVPNDPAWPVGQHEPVPSDDSQHGYKNGHAAGN